MAEIPNATRVVRTFATDAEIQIYKLGYNDDVDTMIKILRGCAAQVTDPARRRTLEEAADALDGAGRLT